MRKYLLLPGVLALSVAFWGCGGGEEAQDAQPGAEAAAGSSTTDATPDESAVAVNTAEAEKAKPAETTPAKPAKTAAAATGDRTSMATGDRVGIATDYVLPEAVMALVVHPQQLLKSPLLANNADVAAQLTEATKKFGLNPTDVEQIVITGGPPSGGEGAEQPVAMVAKFTKPHGGRPTLEKIISENPDVAEIVDVEHNGTTYFHAKPAAPKEGDDAAGDSPFGPPPQQPKDAYVFLANDTTAVMTQDEAAMKQLIDGKGTVDTPLTKALASLDVSSDVVLLLTVNEQLREMAKSGAAQAAGTPFEKLHEQLQQAVVRATLSPDIRLQSTLSLVDEKAAGDLTVAVQGLVQQGLASVEQQVKQMESAPGEGMAPVMLPLFKEIQKLLAGISTDQAGADVVVDFGGLNDLNYQTIGQAAMMMMAMMGGMGGGPAPGNFGPPGGQDFGPPADNAPADNNNDDAGVPADDNGN